MTANNKVEENIMPRIGSFFCVLTALLFAQSCQAAACKNEIIDRIKSPNGVYTAILFERNCGATSGNNFQVSIARSDAETDGPGNSFVVDYPNEYYQEGHPRPVVKSQWVSDSSVTIEYSKGARIFTQAVMVQGVKVNYLIK